MISLRKKCLYLWFVMVLLFSPPVWAAAEWRGHQLDGEISQGFNIGKISGSRESSFVDEGFNYATEANLHYRKDELSELGDWGKSWQIESSVNVRKTDDAQLDQRRDLHLLFLNVHANNDYLDLQFGDFFAQFTDLTLSRGLEGAQVQGTIFPTGTTLTVTAGRTRQAEYETQLSRYTWGTRVEQILAANLGSAFNKTLLNEFTVGSNFIHTFDSGSSSQTQFIQLEDISNQVWSLDSHLRMLDDALDSRFEVARSRITDDNEVARAGDQTGTGVKSQNRFRFESLLGNSQGHFDYERFSPGFVSDGAAISADREAFYAGFGNEFNNHIEGEFGYQESRNNLDDRAGTTLQIANPFTEWKFRPFKRDDRNWRDLFMNARYDFRQNESSDSTSDNHTHDIDLRAGHRFWGLAPEARYLISRRYDFSGGSDQLLTRWGWRLQYDFEKKNIRLSPFAEYFFRNERNFDPRLRDTEMDLQAGMSAEFFSQLRVDFNWGQNKNDRQTPLQDVRGQIWRLNAEYNVSEHWIMQLNYNQRGSDFEENEKNFAERIGELKLIYRV